MFSTSIASSLYGLWYRHELNGRILWTFCIIFGGYNLYSSLNSFVEFKSRRVVSAGNVAHMREMISSAQILTLWSRNYSFNFSTPYT